MVRYFKMHTHAIEARLERLSEERARFVYIFYITRALLFFVSVVVSITGLYFWYDWGCYWDDFLEIIWTYPFLVTAFTGLDMLHSLFYQESPRTFPYPFYEQTDHWPTKYVFAFLVLASIVPAYLLYDPFLQIDWILYLLVFYGTPIVREYFLNGEIDKIINDKTKMLRKNKLTRH